MGLIAATDAIIPVEPRYLETVGLMSVLGKINDIREGWRHPNLRVSGILVTKMDSRIRGHNHLLEELKAHPVLGKLLPQTQQRGNRERKLSDVAWEMLQDFIESHYETARQPYIASVWAAYCQACEREGVTPASLTTFGKAVKARPQEIQTRKRQGKRAAHQIQKQYWHLDATTPKHGERIWHIVHLDHTLLDIQLRHAQTGQVLGRPWATFAVDAYSRRLLAVVLTLDDQPSYRTCMLVLREMVSRFRRLPQTLVVDNGKEFHSTYFQGASKGCQTSCGSQGKVRLTS